MKNTFLRLSALVIALVMALAMLAGCKNPGDTGENGGNTDTPLDSELIQIKTTIYEISKHGNLILYMYGADLYDKGFEHGDIVEIAIGEKTWEVPLCSSYSDVDNGVAVLRAIAPTDGVVLAINMGDFTTSAGIAQKTTIDEDPGYRWDYLVETPVEITITMKEKGGYREEWLIRQLVRTNERSDYSHLSDEAFANFRVINTTGMGKNVLYRSSSPINPNLGRNTYADKAAENAGIKTIVNLADLSDTYEGTEDTYYSTCQVVYVNLGTEFLSEDTLNGIALGMRYIINNDGPYLIHCNEGKDRAGFVSALLECLMGASLDEVIADYMLTYYNYYGVEEGSEKYDVIVKNNLIKVLNTTFKVDDVYKADLAAEASAFLMEDVGLTEDEVAALKAKLTITLQEVYDAGETLSSLLGEHENAYIEYMYNGTVYKKEYLGDGYMYFFYNGEFYGAASDIEYFATESTEYYLSNNLCTKYITLDRSGIIDMKARYDTTKMTSFVMSYMLDYKNLAITQKDGSIIVTYVADSEMIEKIGVEGMVTLEDYYTLDAVTHELTSVRTVYSYVDGTTTDHFVTITRDVEAPEGAKPYLDYEQESENLRTITIVSNPGTENEKTEYVRSPKGLIVTFSIDENAQGTYNVFSDAACTQPMVEAPDPTADVTVYIKWVE